MKLKQIDGAFSIYKAASTAHIDLAKGIVFAARTDDEISLVCAPEYAPDDATHADHGWTMFRVSGTMDFGLVGVIASIATVLAEAGIPIFVISTFDTDYVLVKQEHAASTRSVLASNGHEIE